MSTVFPYQKSVCTHATKHATNCVGKRILKNCQILSFPSPILRFPSPKIQFSSPKIQFSLHEIWFTQIGFLLSLTVSAFFNGFLLSSRALRFLQRLSKFLQRLSDFPQRLSAFQEVRENLFMARSIQKIAIRALYFSPLAPQALWLPINNTYVITQHTPVVHLCSQQCALSKI